MPLPQATQIADNKPTKSSLDTLPAEDIVLKCIGDFLEPLQLDRLATLNKSFYKKLGTHVRDSAVDRLVKKRKFKELIQATAGKPKRGKVEINFLEPKANKAVTKRARACLKEALANASITGKVMSAKGLALRKPDLGDEISPLQMLHLETNTKLGAAVNQAAHQSMLDKISNTPTPTTSVKLHDFLLALAEISRHPQYKIDISEAAVDRLLPLLQSCQHHPEHTRSLLKFFTLDSQLDARVGEAAQTQLNELESLETPGQIS